MKKILLSLICFFACIFSVQAQTLYGLTTNGGNDGVGTLIKFVPGANNLTVSKSFENSVNSPFYTKFIQASDGKLYGMTQYGGNDTVTGSYGGGVIFSFDPSSSTYTKLKNFDGTDGRNPSGSLMQASDGKLYGMTQEGGDNDSGVIFSFNPSTSTYTKLHDFDGTNGAYPRGSLIQANNGKLYGMTYSGGSIDRGVIFSFDPSSSIYTKLINFGGQLGTNPCGSLVQASDGKLYGMAGSYPGWSVIFSFDPSTSTYTKLMDLTDGFWPEGSLMQASNGKLYGMTRYGGSYGRGVIFSFDPSSSVYTKLKDFDGTNGSSPWGDLMQASDGKLYGMTLTGGIIGNSEGGDGNGVIFSFDPSTSTYTKLKDFDCTGGFPYGSLIQASDGKVYGMASLSIFIFSFDPFTSTFTKLKDFAETDDGVVPVGSLVQASDGKLYGMTGAGGNNNLGLIFSFDPSSSTYTKLKNFSLALACDPFSNGRSPTGSLIQASNGKLYAMTAAGGNNDRGVIFSFDPSTSTYTKLMDFDFTNGAWPTGSLMQASDGKLYGMTVGGGSIGNGGSGNGNGVIFSYDPSTSTYTKLKDFDYTNGANPFGSLIQGSDGKLYGMTSGGGSYGPNNSGSMGVIFSYDPSTSTYTKLRDFDFTNGAWPGGSLIQGSDGKLYGMTSGGGSNGTSNDNSYGVIFSFDPSTSTYTKLKDFDGTNGRNPQGNLIQASDGKIYGMTYSGGGYSGGYFGPYGFGVIFSFDPSTSTYTKLKDFDWANGGLPLYGSAFIEVKSGALPVTLISFTGKNIGNNNQLTWKVENEFDLNFYELQRGVDGKNFTRIGQIKATGNKSYNYDDPVSNKVSSTWYYRLKIADKNGTFTYSSICSIIFKATTTNISISPNPVAKSIRLETSSGGLLTGNSATATIRIYSSAMQLLQTKSISAADGNAISIPVEKLASGIYYLQLVNGRDNSVLKFIKE